MFDTKEKENKAKKGISLIVLVITIIVIIILSVAVILTITGNNPILNAQKAVIQNDLRSFQERLALYIMEKDLETEGEFDKESLYAYENEILYNTKLEGESGNIYSVIPEIKGSKYEGKIYIELGELVYSPNNSREYKWAEEIGVRISGFIIIDGVLQSVNEVESLIDETGTLKIPSIVEKIEAGAFYNIPNLKRLIIPGTVKEIASNAFRGNATLEEVIMEEGVEILGSNVFDSCTALTKVELPYSVIQMGECTFMYCRNLQQVKFSSGMKSIPSYTFYDCYGLSGFEIPNSVKTISSGAFNSCNSLEKLYIPSSVVTIQDNAFPGATNVNFTLEVDENNPNYKMVGDTLLTKDGTKLLQIFRGSNITEYSIPEGVTTFGSGTFGTCINLEKIVIPASVESINGNPFNTMKKLSYIEVSEDNPKYSSDEGAIYNKDKTELIYCFSKESKYIVKDSVKILSSTSFSYKTNIEEIVLPKDLERIDVSSFNECKKLKEIKVGANVKSLSSMSFYGLDTTNVTKITIDENNPYYIIENNMLLNKDKTLLIDVLSNIEEIIIPEGVKEIGGNAFHANRNLKKVVIPNTVEKIGGSFNHCSALEKIEIPSSVTSISTSCFSNSTNLKEIIVHREKDSITGSPWGCVAGNKVVIWQP